MRVFDVTLKLHHDRVGLAFPIHSDLAVCESINDPGQVKVVVGKMQWLVKDHCGCCCALRVIQGSKLVIQLEAQPFDIWYVHDWSIRSGGSWFLGPQAKQHVGMKLCHR